MQGELKIEKCEITVGEKSNMIAFVLLLSSPLVLGVLENLRVRTGE